MCDDECSVVLPSPSGGGGGGARPVPPPPSPFAARLPPRGPPPPPRHTPPAPQQTMGIAVLCVCLLLGAALPVGASDCADLSPDLQCSACGHFVSTFFAEVAKETHVFGGAGPSAFGVYRERLRDIYATHAPEKAKTVDTLLRRSAGKEHALYERVCEKYGLDPEDEWAPEEDAEDAEERDAATEAALERAREYPTASKVQWAMVGPEGQRKYQDFQKAISAGGTLSGLEMGPQITEQLQGCFEEFAVKGEDVLREAIRRSAKAYSSGVHKTFCRDIEACPAKGRRKGRDEL